MSQVFDKVRGYGIVPIVAVNEVREARALAKALTEADLPVLEITFRTEAAEEAIKMLTAEFPQFLAGAGTVLTVEQAKKAIGAGAKFILAPGFNPRVVGYCLEQGIEVMPGINNPTQIEQALELGVKTLKYFPAETSGGLEMLKAMSAPFQGLQFVVTGGVRLENLVHYLGFSKVFACGGSWIATPQMIAAGNWAEVTRIARESVKRVLGFELRQLGFEKSLPSGLEALLAGLVASNQESLLTIKTNSLERTRFYMGTRGLHASVDPLNPRALLLESGAGGLKIRFLEE